MPKLYFARLAVVDTDQRHRPEDTTVCYAGIGAGGTSGEHTVRVDPMLVGYTILGGNCHWLQKK